MPEELRKAALAWWKANRPVGWSTADHMCHPAVNTVGEEESRLARAVARMVRQRARVAKGRKCSKG